MTGQQANSNISALRKLEACLQSEVLACAPAGPADKGAARAVKLPKPIVRIIARSRLYNCWRHLRKTAYVAGALAAVVMVAFVALWWRLSNGPIELDLATP
jgi:hypothetical protein